MYANYQWRVPVLEEDADRDQGQDDPDAADADWDDGEDGPPPHVLRGIDDYSFMEIRVSGTSACCYTDL